MNRTIAAAAMLSILFLTGCQMTPAHAWYRNEWRGLSYDEAAQYLDGYSNVLLVCITSDHVKERCPGNPARWSAVFYEGTVVRNYKGDWNVGERVKFAYGLDSTAAKLDNKQVGKLEFLFTDVHTNTVFGVETGDFEGYDSETDRLLRSLLPDHWKN